MSISLLELEKYLWRAFNELRGSIAAHEAVDYLTGLFFLRFLSEAFDRHVGSSNAEAGECEKSSEFYVPREARWNKIRESSNPSEAVSRALQVVRVGEMRLVDSGLFSSLRRLEKSPSLL